MGRGAEVRESSSAYKKKNWHEKWGGSVLGRLLTESGAASDGPVPIKPIRVDHCLKHRSECTTGNTGIARGRGRGANKVRGEAECFISLETTPEGNISRSARA